MLTGGCGAFYERDMASPQIENGYTRIANELLEALAKFRINGEAQQILYVIFRKTYGFSKKEDAISLSQFCDATKLERAHVCRAITKLTDLHIVLRRRSKRTTFYSLNKNWEQWSAETGTVPKRATIIAETGNQTVPKRAHTKERNKKETMSWKKYKEPIIDSDTNELESLPLKKVPEKDIKWFFYLFKDNPAHLGWIQGNTTQRGAAERLLEGENKGKEKIKNAVAYARLIKSEPYAPQINSPLDLEQKWTKLQDFKEKHG